MQVPCHILPSLLRRLCIIWYTKPPNAEMCLIVMVMSCDEMMYLWSCCSIYLYLTSSLLPFPENIIVSMVRVCSITFVAPSAAATTNWTSILPQFEDISLYRRVNFLAQQQLSPFLLGCNSMVFFTFAFSFMHLLKTTHFTSSISFAVSCCSCRSINASTFINLDTFSGRISGVLYSFPPLRWHFLIAILADVIAGEVP